MRKKRSFTSEKVRAFICHHCPLCKHARNHPESFVAKIVYRRHAKDCPKWNAEQEVYGKEPS